MTGARVWPESWNISLRARALAVVLSCCVEKSGPPKASGPLWRSHFAGVRAINENTDPLVFKKVWNLPSSGDLRKQALDKIAQTPFQLWQKSLPAGVANGASLIRPLLDDLVNSESFVEIKGPESDFDSALAIQLDASRSQLWKTNL